VATKAKPIKKGPDILDQPVVKNDWDKLVEHVRQNPVLYGAGVLFVLLCIIAGVVFRSSGQQSQRSVMTAYARAIESDDAAKRVTELEPIVGGKGKTAAEALYVMGESAFEAKDYEKAKTAFERLRAEFSDSAYVPEAVEGLGYVAENGGQFEQALGYYKEILDKWPSSLAGRRQSLNIGRCQEQLGKLADAVSAYREQVDQFPGSSSEKAAQSALDRLEKAHPELFPKEEVAEAAPASSPDQAQDPTAAPEVVVAPAAENPAPAPAPADASQGQSQ